MELKHRLYVFHRLWSTTINRTIMELKLSVLKGILTNELGY